MFGWLSLTMLFVVAVTLIVIVVGGHIAQKRAMLGCGFSRQPEPENWPEAELDGEPLFERPRDYEWPRA